MKLLPALLLLALPTLAGAQDYRASILYIAPADSAVDSLPPFRPPVVPVVEQPNVGYPIMVGVLAGVAGAAAGIAIGANTEDYYDDIPPGAVYGYFIGETLCMPLGVHLGNQRHGNFAGDLGLSVLGHLASIAIGSIGGQIPGYAIGMAGTVAITVANERAVGRRRLAEQASGP